MNKKVFGIVAITILILGISLAQPVMAQREEEKVNAKLIGFIRIDSSKYEIKGFVFFGNNAGELILLKPINIKYVGDPIFISHPLPFIYNIKYTPAK
ncbi:MAG: hypothetical protein AYK22_02455 [Thermoplasmatales archaeon SG8-52-3]|nr:MAG: hypothetical protein AYK22_02455 [Thermoplasmatales archaeon SG8-52-3]